MKLGDFSRLALNYKHRPAYSETVIRCLMSYTGAIRSSFKVADVGAGTGKLTEMFARLGMNGYAVEPNDAMRREGIKTLSKYNAFCWSKGTGEKTGLKTGCADWVTMASSFHWTDHRKSLKEFHRILRPGGFFTALWNPRDVENDELQKAVQEIINKHVPEAKRVSSGSSKYTLDLDKKLVSTGHFADVIFLEAKHTEIMSPERYLGAWRSVNDIQAQAGPVKFKEIMTHIGKLVKGKKEVALLYKTRAWIAKSI